MGDGGARLARVGAGAPHHVRPHRGAGGAPRLAQVGRLSRHVRGVGSLRREPGVRDRPLPGPLLPLRPAHLRDVARHPPGGRHRPARQGVDAPAGDRLLQGQFGPHRARDRDRDRPLHRLAGRRGLLQDRRIEDQRAARLCPQGAGAAVRPPRLPRPAPRPRPAAARPAGEERQGVGGGSEGIEERTLMMRKTGFVLAALLLTAALAAAAVPPDIAEYGKRIEQFPATRRQGSESERLRKLFDLLWDYQMHASPEYATFVGYPGLDDRWSDLSPESIEFGRRLTHTTRTAPPPGAALASTGRARLTPAGRFNSDLAHRPVREGIEGEPFHGEYMPITQL